MMGVGSGLCNLKHLDSDLIQSGSFHRISVHLNKLKEVLNTKASTFGATEEGAAWCIKALHPSDPMVDVEGIPDESAVPSMFLNFQSTRTLSPQTGATGTWRCDGQLVPHPLSFGWVQSVDSVGPQDLGFRNVQISPESADPTPATWIDMVNAWDSAYTRWRLAYMSITIYQDGPALANQGTVVACQKPVNPALRHQHVFNVNVDAFTYDNDISYPPSFYLAPHDSPNYDTSQAMPNAYFGKSKDGLYMPLKLTRTHQKWHSRSDYVMQAFDQPMLPFDYAVNPGLSGQYPVYSSGSAYAYGVRPFFGTNCSHVSEGPGYRELVGLPIPDFCNDNWGDFSFRNMSVESSLSFFIRAGFEVQLQPASIMAPHLQISPTADELATATYFRIARELKDAYPADYNDLGKIWKVISSVAKTVAPALNFIPGVGPILARAVPMVAGAGDAIASSVSRAKGPTKGNVASATDKARAKAIVKNRLTPRLKRK